MRDLLDTLFVAAPAPMALLDVELRYAWVNPAFADLFGRAADGWVSRCFSETAPAPELEAMARRSLERGEPEVAEGVLHAPPQGPRASYWDWTLTPIAQSAGGGSALLVTLQDATARVQALADLDESRHRLQSVLDAIPLCVYWMDRDGLYQGCNASFARDVGMSGSGEVVGRSDADLSRPWSLPGTFPRAESADTDDKVFTEERVKTPEGRSRWLCRAELPLTSSTGAVTGLLGLYEDVTARKRAERDLQLAHTAINKSSTCFYWLSPEGQVLYVNDASCDALGYRREELVGLFIWDFDPAYKPEHQPLAWAAIRDQGSFSTESYHRRKDGSVFPIEVNANYVGFGDSEYAFCFVQDISERRRAERELKLAHTAINKSKSGFYWLSPTGQVIEVNEAAAESLGYAREELIGLHVWDFDPDFSPDSNDDAWAAVRRHGSVVLQSRHRRKDGTVFPIEATANYVCMEGEEYIFTFVQDISDRKAAEEKIRRLAFFDPLTRLPNRRLLIDRIEQALVASARSRRHGAVMFIDLDNFKSLNDTLGHNVGDLLLIEVTKRLRSTLREADTVARLGGDEFVVMLPALSDDRARAESVAGTVARMVRSALHHPFQLGGHEHSTSCSIGVCLFDGARDQCEELLSRADTAMYAAKRAGRDTVRFFDPAMQRALAVRAQLEARLRRALPRRQLELHYQLQVDAARKPIGVEALLRWRHPDEGLISPATFIPVAEETGLILPIGDWVTQTVLAQAQAWRSDALLSRLTISINVSARQFRQPGFVEDVRRALDRSGIDPARVKLELTESLVLHDVEDTVEKMHGVRALGVGFSLDDFGTGHSSLTYLKRLPLDQLKIDHSFVRDITTDPNDATLVQAIVGVGRNLGLQVIAEGVETEAQLALLRSYGCEAFQGFLFGRPSPSETIPQQLVRAALEASAPSARLADRRPGVPSA